MLQTFCYQNWQDLSFLEETWNELSARGPGVKFFQSLEWFRLLSSLQPENVIPFILVVYALDRPVGILPLCQQTISTPMGKIKQLGYFPCHAGVPLGVIGPNQAATLAGALKFIKLNEQWGDLLELAFVEKTYLDQGRTLNAFHMASWQPIQSTSPMNSALIHLKGLNPLLDHNHSNSKHSTIMSYRSSNDSHATLTKLLQMLDGQLLIKGDLPVWQNISDVLRSLEQSRGLELIIQRHHEGCSTVLISSFTEQVDKRTFQLFFCINPSSLRTPLHQLSANFFAPEIRTELFQFMIESSRACGDQRLILSPVTAHYLRSHLADTQLVYNHSYRQYAWHSLRSQFLKYHHLFTHSIGLNVEPGPSQHPINYQPCVIKPGLLDDLKHPIIKRDDKELVNPRNQHSSRISAAPSLRLYID